MLSIRYALLFILLTVGPGLVQGQVVINEILYHAPDDLDDLQFIELHNAGSQALDLGGWALTKGVKFKFPAGTRIESQGFIVLCANPARFREHYDIPALGSFESKLSRKGESIGLSDAKGQLVDQVTFSDRAPWPTGADGRSGSLERICPHASGLNSDNWISSPLQENRDMPGGTPGRPNAGFSSNLPPIIKAVTFTPEWPAPAQPVTIEAAVPENQVVTQVSLLFRQAGPGFEKEESKLAMRQMSPGRYAATIPSPGIGQLLRFRVEALGPQGSRRLFPAETEPRPALSLCVLGTVDPAKIPFGWIIHTTEKEMNDAQARANAPRFGGFGPPPNRGERGRNRAGPGQGPPQGGFPAGPPRGPEGEFRGPPSFGPGGTGRPGPFFGGPFGGPPSEPGSHRSAFVYFDPTKRTTELFDFVQVNGRKGGQKVHFHKDRALAGMTTVALIFEGETAALVEPLAYEVYRRAGMPVEQSYHVRLWQDGKPDGYSLLVEQPNGAFLRRNKIKDGGNMYKLLWFGGDLKGQHEKHSNRHQGHEDLAAVVDGLKKTSGDAQWAYIREQFDVEEVATYFAANMVLSHWDGFFNNYFTYHEPGGKGRWTMFPWDQDSTWGLRGGDGGELFYDMPLTFGMAGDTRQSGGFWWRPPGFFSGPLLANPSFRRLFLARTKHILEAIYTEPVFGPVLDRLAEQLAPEVRLRAELHKEDPARALQQLRHDLARCREHLVKRRNFLLAQSELKSIDAAPPPPATSQR